MSKRTLLAFIGAPLLPALVPSWFVYVNRAYEPLSVFVFFCLVAYVLQTVIGVPAYMLLSRNKMHRLWIYVLLGFFGGALPLLLLTLRKHEELGYSFNQYWILLYPGILGAGNGLFFWLLARPGKTHANSSDAAPAP